MKIWALALWVVFAVSGAGAQKFIWQPAAGHTQAPIWPGAAPDQEAVPGPETSETVGTKDFVAGRAWIAVENVARPTMTVYSPKGKNTGVAVVVYPGGGYEILAIDLEGSEVCDWLVDHGMTCVLLKYRVPVTHRTHPYWGAYTDSKMALDDAQRTMGLVRLHAAEWGVDPHKVGVLGFSAGGSLVAEMSVHWAKRLYAPVDAADRESCRPDFAVAIYPGHLSLSDDGPGINPDIASHIRRDTPPTFLLQNEDDDVDGVNQVLVYYAALRKAGVPVEMHLYAQGGHAFGLRPTKLPATHWPDLMETWLRTIGMLE